MFESNRNGTFGSRSVLFAPNVTSSSSSYSISEHLKSNNQNGNTTNVPTTSQLIKQTLSPLSQHRIISSSPSPSSASYSFLDSSFSSSLVKNPSNSASLGTYQFPSSSLTLSKDKDNKSANDNNKSSSSSSSPSRTIANNNNISSNNTNTLPSSIVRNLYQSESSYSLRNQETNFTSPGNSINWNSQNSNIYGTLPKSSSPFSSIGSMSTATNLTGNVASVKNEFEQLIARNQALSASQSTLGSSGISSSGTGSSGLNTSSSSTSDNYSSNTSASGMENTTKGGLSYGNYNTIGSYRLQYSSTNPFLPSFNPNSTELLANNSEQTKEDK